jgi:hypothetical protein
VHHIGQGRTSAASWYDAFLISHNALSATPPSAPVEESPGRTQTDGVPRNQVRPLAGLPPV